MNELVSYSLEEIKIKLVNHDFPFSGITKSGTAEFHFEKPACYAGIALHAGHNVRPEILPLFALSEEERFRDEDPYTHLFIKDFPIRVIALDSRFEYDLNRERHRCIYDTYVEKWGLNVWQKKPCEEIKKRSREKYDEFYGLMDILSEFLALHNPYTVMYDMHSFCYQRERQKAWQQDPRPEINIGTKAANRDFFAPVINRLKKELSETRIRGRKIRVAENEVFSGGYLSRRISRKYFNQILVLSLEYKKIFMNEITGIFYPEVLNLLVSDFRRAVNKTGPPF